MYRLAFSILTVFGFAACNQKDLVYYSDENLDLNVSYNRVWQLTYPGSIDWKFTWDSYNFGFSYCDLLPDVPTGLRVVEYDDDSQVAVHNIASYGGVVNISDDDNSLIIFNNDTEYIVYEDLDNITDALASTRSVQRTTYHGSPYVRNAVRLVNPPDMLYNASLNDVDKYDFNGNLNLVMQPMVFTYLIRYQFDYGLDYVAVARGALAGMAEDVWLKSGIPGETAATLLYDCQIKEWGVEAIVKSFGTPSLSPDQRYGLNLEVRLKNGKILDFNFDVTCQISLQPRGGVVEIRGINIPDDVGKEESGAFDVNVEGWGEFKDIPIDF